MFAEEIVKAIIDELGDKVLPHPEEISYYVLEKERKLFLDFDICPDVMDIVKMILRWNIQDLGKQDRKPIWIYVMSWGGDLDYMRALIDAIESSETPIYTVNMGVAGSAAALIFLSGKKRFMMKNSKLIVHEGSAELSGDAVKIMDATENYKKDLRWMKEYIEKHSAIPHNALMKKRNNDWYLDANYCLENKACEKIVENLSEVAV